MVGLKTGCWGGYASGKEGNISLVEGKPEPFGALFGSQIPALTLWRPAQQAFHIVSLFVCAGSSCAEELSWVQGSGTDNFSGLLVWTCDTPPT